MRLKVSNVCQLLDKSKFPATQTKQGVTYTNDGNGIITLNGTNTASYLCVFVLNEMDGKPGHKYMQLGATDDGFWNRYGLELKWVDGDGVGHGFTMTNGIMSIPSDAIVRNIYVSALVYQGYTVSNKTFKPQLFDLTEMYGAGNEPTTIAQFRQDFPNEMYEYSPVCWKRFSRLKYVTETKNLFKLNDFSNSWLTIKNNTIRIKKTSDLQSYSDAIFSPLQTDLKSDKYYRISAKVIGEFTGRLYKFFGNSLWGNAINNNRWQSDFTLATVEDKYGLEINQNSTTTVGCTLISDEVFIYDIMLEESDAAFVGQAEYVPSGYLPLNRGKYIANKEPVQLLDKSKYYRSSTVEGVTFTNNGDGTWTVVGTAPDVPANKEYVRAPVIVWNLEFSKKHFIPGHKIVVAGGVSTDSAGKRAIVQWVWGWTGGYDAANSWERTVHTIRQYSEDKLLDWSNYIELRVYAGATVNFTFKPQFFDLTAMYGAGNEPTTVEQFRADFPNELYDYNPYNAITFR